MVHVGHLAVARLAIPLRKDCARSDRIGDVATLARALIREDEAGVETRRRRNISEKIARHSAHLDGMIVCDEGIVSVVVEDAAGWAVLKAPQFCRHFVRWENVKSGGAVEFRGAQPGKMVEEDDVRRFPGNEHDDVGQADVVVAVVECRIFAIERARIDDDLLSVAAAGKIFWREIVQNIFWKTSSLDFSRFLTWQHCAGADSRCSLHTGTRR